MYCIYMYLILCSAMGIQSHTVNILTPSISVSTTEPTAGAPLTLTCDYTLSPSVDTTVETAVSWTVNSSVVDTSQDGISTDGDTLTFSPLTTSDTGRYRCVVHSSTYIIVVEGPKQSNDYYMPVASK